MMTIIKALLPVAFWVLQKWVMSQKRDEMFLKDYHRFLDNVDKSGQIKVANHIAATNALREEQQRLLEELKNEQGNKR